MEKIVNASEALKLTEQNQFTFEKVMVIVKEKAKEGCREALFFSHQFNAKLCAELMVAGFKISIRNAPFGETIQVVAW